MNWKKNVLVTGGASFIGSHLVDLLVKKGAHVRVVDNFSSGRRENIKQHTKKKSLELITADLRDSAKAKTAVKNIDIVFHLACDHGGRGYVNLHQAACSTNFLLDGNVFYASAIEGVDKIVFASSGCVYPNYLQTNPEESLYLVEDRVGPPYDADNMYGWAKLMGEKTLKAYHDEWGMKTVSLRFFTVYGERGVENHAVIGMIAKAFLRLNPYPVWGDGTQVRNWTYVGDIVRGCILAAEKVDDGSSINLGTRERITVIQAAREILRYTNHDAQIVFEKTMPTGPQNRVADNKKAKKILGWVPEVKFFDGLSRTIDWYFSTKSRKEVMKYLPKMLIGRESSIFGSADGGKSPGSGHILPETREAERAYVLMKKDVAKFHKTVSRA